MRPTADCTVCRHYYITWDERFPYGCRALDFKSRNRPDAEVWRTSGEVCLAFTPKPGRPEEPREIP